MSCHGCTGVPCTICHSGYNNWYLQPVPQCQCPTAWWGTSPPYCPVHNPGYATTTIRLYPQPTQPAPELSPADIEKIAQRVAQLLKGG